LQRTQVLRSQKSVLLHLELSDPSNGSVTITIGSDKK